MAAVESTPPVLKLSNIVEKFPRFDRIATLSQAFETEYGEKPDFVARAPGRVNLIGEHIDYHGYGVLPMALDQDILVACSTDKSSRLQLKNISQEYPEYDDDLRSFSIDCAKPLWYHYVLCGVKGIFEECKIMEPCGMKLLVDGKVPRSAGLSSSSALVCVSALTTMYANGKSLSKTEIANVCTWSEKYIGTQGGGMDQSISFLAEKGTAKKIDFNPLSAFSVSLPKGAVFVVTNSCVELNKAATSHFNTRVLEGQLGVYMLAKHHGLEWKSYKKMKMLQDELKKDFDELISEVRVVLHRELYTRQEVCKILEISDDLFSSQVLNDKTRHLLSFNVYDRTMHVLTESQRVLKFLEVCRQQPEGCLKLLGDLMNASHVSCRDQYECSSEGLDTLTDVCLKAGALGSRLTGAGWAGCCVSLVPINTAEKFLEIVKKEFYERQGLKCDSSIMFITAPGDGAMIYEL